MGGFATVAFGGESRIENIRQMLERLRARGIEVIVLTKGLVGTVRKCLFDLGLLDLFSDVYGNVGDNYGETSYDEAISRSKPSPHERKFIASPDNNLSTSKAEFIQRWASDAGLSWEQVCLCEDDPEEIRCANPVCRTLYVKDAQGMTSSECSNLLQMAEGQAARSVGKANSRPVFGRATRPKDVSNSTGELDRQRFEMPSPDLNSSKLVSTTPKFRSSMQELGPVPQFNPRMSMLAEGDEEDNHEEDTSNSLPKPLDAQAPLSGWLSKRGPMFGYRWSQVWCVMESTGLTYYSDENCSKKKGDVLISATTKAIAFRDCAIGESVKHAQEKPLGFVIDVDPSKGKSRKLIYFDAGSEDALNRWTEAISNAARKLLALEMFPSEVGYGKFGAKKT